MKFSEFSQFLLKLDSTTKRLEMTSILKDLIEKTPTPEVEIALFLSLGTLKAPYEDLKFNLADKQMIKILATLFSKDADKVLELYQKEGDLGNVYLELAQNTDFDKERDNFSIREVYEKLSQIALTSGTGSQEKKATFIIDLLSKVDHLSGKYLIRIILGNLRLGFTELTIIDALSQYLGDKKYKEAIEGAFNRFPNIGLIAHQLKKSGFAGIEDIKITPGVPVQPQKAQRLGSAEEIIDKMGEVWCEYKFDGTRVQLHLDRSQKISTNESLFQNENSYLVKTFTRNLEETTHQYPDIIEDAHIQIDATSVILDGEAIGFNPKTGEYLPFQETIQRKRKHSVAEMVKEIPLKYLVFDLLYLNGEETINLSLLERRKLLNQIIKRGGNIEIYYHVETAQPSQVLDFFHEDKKKNLEGIMVKKPNSKYEAGARAYSWIKFKREDINETADTLDVTIMGYFYGKGDRAGFGIGGFLVGIYDPKIEKFTTISKIGSGLTDEEWVELKKNCDAHQVLEKPKNFEVVKDMEPDVWIDPKLVVVVRADEVTKSPIHTSGVALRFPRLMNFRYDKSPFDTTSLEEIKQIYKLKF